MVTNWSSLINAKGSMREQSRRESNGRPHRETMRINLECAAERGPRQYKREPSIDRTRINDDVKRRSQIAMHDDIRARFGPRLVRKDGTALFQFQCKK